MNTKKTYRTEWIIESVKSDVTDRTLSAKWYRGTIDMDNVHYCTTEEEAEREIDDAIIMEQEAHIGKLKTAVLESTACFRGVQDFYTAKGTPLVTIADQITRNENLLKQL